MNTSIYSRLVTDDNLGPQWRVFKSLIGDSTNKDQWITCFEGLFKEDEEWVLMAQMMHKFINERLDEGKEITISKDPKGYIVFSANSPVNA